MKLTALIILLVTFQANAAPIDDALKSALIKAGATADASDPSLITLGPLNLQCETGTPPICFLYNTSGETISTLKYRPALDLMFALRNFVRSGGAYSNEGDQVERSSIYVEEIAGAYCETKSSGTWCHLQLETQD